jgi:hypothetical protein
MIPASRCAKPMGFYSGNGSSSLPSVSRIGNTVTVLIRFQEFFANGYATNDTASVTRWPTKLCAA